MNRYDPAPAPDPTDHGTFLIPPALVLLLGLFPPETRGESLAGCALLIGLAAIFGWPGGARPGQMLLLAFAPLAAVAYFFVAEAAGALVSPFCIGLLAVAAGAATSRGSEGAGRSLGLTLAAVGALAAGHGLFQVLGGLDTLAEAIESGLPVADREALLMRARAGRAFAGFPTPAALGGYMILALPITVASALRRIGPARWALLGLALVQVAGLLATSSATAAAALIVAVALAGLLRPGSRRVAALVVLLLLVLLAAVVAARGRQLTRLNDPDSAWRLRAGNFRIAGEIVAERPWVGAGPGGFAEVYPQYRRVGDNESRHVHNLPLELLAELGIPVGTIVFGAFFVVFLFPLVRRNPSATAAPPGVEIGLAAFAIHNLADFTAFLPSLLWTAALLRGSLVELNPADRTVRWGIPAVSALGSILLAVVLTGLAGLAWNGRMQARQAAGRGDFALAELLAQRAVRLAPWNPDGWLAWSGSALQAEKDGVSADKARLEEIRRRLDRALSLSPVRPAAYHQRARVRLLQGDLPGAYTDASEAARLYPLQPRYSEDRDALARRIVVAP